MTLGYASERDRLGTTLSELRGRTFVAERVSGDRLADRIPIFALENLLLPHTDLGVHVYEDPYRALVSHSLSNGHTFGVVLSGHDVGTLARISGYARLPDGRYLLEVEG